MKVSTENGLKNLIVFTLSIGFLTFGWFLKDTLLIPEDDYLFGVVVGTIIAVFNKAFSK